MSKARQINPDVASWPVMFLGPLTLLYIQDSSMSFQAYFKNVSWFVKAVLVRTLYSILFFIFFDSSSPVHKLLSGKAGWKPRWRSRTHWRDNVSWLAWERSLKVTTMSNLPHTWFGHSLCTHANWSLRLCNDCLIFTESKVCVSFSEKSEKVWSCTICQLKHIIPAVFLAVFSDSGGTKESFAVFVRVHFGLLWSINTAEFNHRSVCPSKCSPYVQVLTVCCTQLFESIMKPVICEWHLSLWDSQFAVSHRGAPHYQDSGCIVQRQRGWRGHIEATHKMEHALKFHVWQRQTEELVRVGLKFLFPFISIFAIKNMDWQKSCLNMRDSMWCQLNKNNIKHLDRKRT